MAKGLLVIRMSRPFAAKSAAYWVMKNVRPQQQASPHGHQVLDAASKGVLSTKVKREAELVRA